MSVFECVVDIATIIGNEAIIAGVVVARRQLCLMNKAKKQSTVEYYHNFITT